MKLLAFTYPGSMINENEVLESLLPHIDALHFRKEVGFERINWRKLLHQIDVSHHHKIWLHDHYDLFTEFNIGGLHLTRRWMNDHQNDIDTAIENWKSGALSISVSCHNINDMAVLEKLADRIFLSPIFESISKPGYRNNFNWNEVEAELCKDHNAEIVALGGVELSNTNKLRLAGFDGIAILGALWQNSHPVEYIRIIEKKCKTGQTTY